MKYNPEVVRAYFRACGLPEPRLEYEFAPPRKWRFDFAWLAQRVALEVQGGIFIRGRHNQGAALKQEWEKLNAAARRGWRVLFCEPRDVCMQETADLLRDALAWVAR